MRYRLLAAALLVAVVLPGGGARAQASRLVAADRCNDRMVNDYVTQIRTDDARPPRDNPGDMEKRFDDISTLLAGLEQERGILDIMCSSDGQKAPYFAQIGSAAAWGLALQSDIANKLGLPCAAGAKAFSQTLLAQAWLDLASIVAAGGGSIPADVAQVAPRVQSRARALDLTLPSYADTSGYWRDTVAAGAKTALQSCPTPSPSPRPPLLQSPGPFYSPRPAQEFLRIVRK